MATLHLSNLERVSLARPVEIRHLLTHTVDAELTEVAGCNLQTSSPRPGRQLKAKLPSEKETIATSGKEEEGQEEEEEEEEDL